MASQEIHFGWPDNKLSMSEGLFPDPLYFLCCHNGIPVWNAFMKGKNTSGFVEQHFQQPAEVEAILQSSEKMHEYLRTMEDYRKEGLQIIMHAPFLVPHNPQEQRPLEFDFSWLIGVGGEKPVTAFPFHGRQIAMHGKEADIRYFKKTIDLASSAKIPYLTIHVTKPATFLDARGLAAYESRFQELLSYAQGSGVVLAIETGGILPQDLVRMHQNLSAHFPDGIAINLDTAHLLYDLMEQKFLELVSQGMSKEEAQKLVIASKRDEYNQEILRFYENNRRNIRVVHVTQTSAFADQHLRIEEGGAVTCNPELISLIAQQPDETLANTYVMAETLPTRKTVFIVADATKTSPYALMTMGYPLSGKSTTLKILQKEGGLENCLVVSTDDIRTQNKQQPFSAAEWITLEQRMAAYTEAFGRASDALSQGTSVAIDATFDNATTRALFFDKIASYIQHLYVLEVNGAPAELATRINPDPINAPENGEYKINTPEKLYRFITEFQVLSPEEYATLPGIEVHRIIIDTTPANPSITLQNPDRRAWAMAATLRDLYLQEFKINYLLLEQK